MSIETYSAKLAAGNVYVNIETAGSAVFTDLLDMSSIQFDFDLAGTDQDVKQVGGIAGTATIKVMDELSNGGSAYDSLKSAIGTYTGVKTLNNAPIANATLYFTPLAGAPTYRFMYDVFFTGVKNDEKSNHTSIILSQRASNRNVHTIATNGTNYVPPRINVTVYNGTAINLVTQAQNVITAGDFIRATVGDLDASSPTTILQRKRPAGGITIPFFCNANDISASAVATNLAVPYIPVGSDSDQVFQFSGLDTRQTSAVSLLKKMAGMDGAIFGTAFSNNFYTHRSINSSNVSLSVDDVEELSFAEDPRATFSVSARVTNAYQVDTSSGEQPVLTNSSNTRAMWPFGSQNINVSISADAFNYNDGLINHPFIYIGVATGRTNVNSNLSDLIAYPAFGNAQTFTENIMAQSTQEMSSAFGALFDNTGNITIPLRIEATVQNVLKFQPFQVVKFDSSLPARYQGKHFRPSSVEYDLKKDKIRISAYEIL